MSSYKIKIKNIIQPLFKSKKRVITVILLIVYIGSWLLLGDDKLLTRTIDKAYYGINKDFFDILEKENLKRNYDGFKYISHSRASDKVIDRNGKRFYFEKDGKHLDIGNIDILIYSNIPEIEIFSDFTLKLSTPIFQVHSAVAHSWGSDAVNTEKELLIWFFNKWIKVYTINSMHGHWGFSNDGTIDLEKNNFSLLINFNVLDNKNQLFLTNPDELLYSCVMWFKRNSKQLYNKNMRIIVGFNQKNTYRIDIKKYTNKKNRADGDSKWEYDIIKYSDTSIKKDLINNLNKVCGIDDMTDAKEICDKNIYAVYSKEYEDITRKQTMIFFGIGESYRYNYNKEKYFAVFWELSDAENYYNQLNSQEKLIEEIQLTKKNINNLFRKIELVKYTIN